MSYSQIVLSENPYGYWEFSGGSETTNNIIYSDAYGDMYDAGSTQIQDLSIRSNNINISGILDEYKPIIPGCIKSIKFTNTQTANIDNVYGLFFRGTENKNFTIEFFFSIDSSSIEDEHSFITIGNFLKCYVKSDKVYLEANSQQVFVPIPTWDSSNYVAISYENRVLTLVVNSSIEKILLGTDYFLPDTSAPDIVIGPSANASMSFFINALALYSYVISNDQINRRSAWSKYLPSIKEISSVYGADYFNFSYSPILNQQKVLLTSPDVLSGSLSNNIEVFEDSIKLFEYRNPIITGDQYVLNSEGLSLGDSTYLNLVDIKKSINNSNFCIRLQSKVLEQINNSAKEETLLEFGPLDNYQSCRLYKSEDKKITLSLIYLDGTEENILQSSTITNFSSYHNVALNINNQLVSLKVNSQELSYQYPFPAISSNPFFNLGNSSSGDTPLAGKIKNFTVDQATDFSQINFTEVGKYTLKLLGDLKVSQRGQWYYSFTPTEPILSSYVTYNTASKNSTVYVNNVQVDSNTIVPDLDYENNDPINIKIDLFTDDSENDLAIFNNLYLVLYQDVEIASENALYTISPIPTSSSEVKIEPYVINTESSSFLSKPDNLGIKFINQKTSGGVTYPYDDSGLITIRFVDFIIKLDSIPTTETFTIIDTPSSINKKLTYTSGGLQKTGTFTLYVDGVVANSNTQLKDKDFYHIAVDFGTTEPDTIFIGSDRSGLNGMSGSIGELTINENLPSSVPIYLDLKNQALIGRVKIVCEEDDEISLLDNQSPVQSVSIDGGKYFEMTTLPKIKAIENRWQNISVPE
jgi:hypothetical protein